MAISRGRIEKGERKKSRLNFFSSSSSFSPPTRHQLHSYILFNSCQPCRSLFPLPRTDRSRPMNISRVSQINAFVYKYSSSARNALTFGSRPDRHRPFSSLRSILPGHLRQIDRARKYRRGNEPVNNEPFPSLTTRLLLRSRDSYHSTFRGNLHARVSSPPSHTHPRVSPTRFESLNHRRRAADRSGTVPCFGCTVSVLWIGMVFRRVRLEDPFERREIVFSHGGRYATLRPIILLLLLYYIWNFRSLAKYYSPSLRFQETKGEKYMEHSLRELYLREAS